MAGGDHGPHRGPRRTALPGSHRAPRRLRALTGAVLPQQRAGDGQSLRIRRPRGPHRDPHRVHGGGELPGGDQPTGSPRRRRLGPGRHPCRDPRLDPGRCPLRQARRRRGRRAAPVRSGATGVAQGEGRLGRPRPADHDRDPDPAHPVDDPLRGSRHLGPRRDAPRTHPGPDQAPEPARGERRLEVDRRRGRRRTSGLRGVPSGRGERQDRGGVGHRRARAPVLVASRAACRPDPRPTAARRQGGRDVVLPGR